ncbi:MAG: ankyrin repeat domain-containing protein [Gammaproteobacteria bacterium]
MQRQQVRRYLGLLALVGFGLAACSREEPAPATAGDYQPASLLQAVLLGNRSAVDEFIALGADVNAAEDDGTTPLMRAVHGHFTDIAKRLIASGADVTLRNRYGVTALYLAARGGDAAMTRELLVAGLDADTALPGGETALMTAARSGHTDVVGVLLTGNNGVESLADLAGRSAASERSGYAAESAGYGDTERRVPRRNRADVNARERRYGDTALMWAAVAGYVDVVRLLIEAGADVRAVDDEGMTALQLARANGHTEVASALLAAGANPNG